MENMKLASKTRLFLFWERFGFPIVLTCLVIAFAYLSFLTQGKLGDAFIDYGRELEIPWKITQGKMLYRDAVYFYGPLSPYFNALLLKVFGVHLNTIIFSGFISVISGALLIYFIARHFLHQTAALALIAVFFMESVFQHYLKIGTYTFIAPYSFSAVHSILFAFAALLLLLNYLKNPKKSLLIAAGFSVGLTALCKIEIAGAIFTTIAAFTFFIDTQLWIEPQKALVNSLLWLIPFSLVVVIGYLPFILSSSYEQVVFYNIFKSNLVDPKANRFFINPAWRNYSSIASKIFISISLWTSAIVTALLLSKTLDPTVQPRKKIHFMLALIPVIVILTLLTMKTYYRNAYALLPLILVATMLVAVYKIKRNPQDSIIEKAALTFSLFSLLALSRMMLKWSTVGSFHYGFFMCLPALILFGVFLTALVPRWLNFNQTTKQAYIFFILFFFIFISARHFVDSSLPNLNKRTLIAQTERGQISIYSGYKSIHQAFQFLSTYATPNQTLFVIPEGAAFNFLINLKNPTSFITAFPFDLQPSELEDKLVSEISENKVDYILIISRDFTEYGYHGPGLDYGFKLMNFINRNYDIIQQYGALPYQTTVIKGGIAIYRRK
jgi:hypothetical protein